MDYLAYWPSSLPSCLSTIESINHQVYRPSSLSTIESIENRAYRPSGLLTIEPLTIKPINHWTYQPLSLSTIEPLTIKPINHLSAIWPTFATSKQFRLVICTICTIKKTVWKYEPNVMMHMCQKWNIPCFWSPIPNQNFIVSHRV